MHIGFGMNPAAFSRATTGPSQAQVNAQVSTGGGSMAARDQLVRTDRRRRSMQCVGVELVGTHRMLDRAGITKVSGAKKR